MDMHVADKLRRYRNALFINFAVVIAQTLIYFLAAESKSLLGDMLHSLADSIVLFGLFVLTRCEYQHPKRDRHNAEHLFTKGAIVLLWLSACYVGYEGVERIRTPEAFFGEIVIAVTLVAIIGNFFAHHIMSGVAKSVHDHKHRASITHVLADLVISIVVLFSALLTVLFGMPALDGWGALIVALWMGIRGIQLWRSGNHAH